MSTLSNNAPQKQARAFSSWVWFEGAASLKEGQGVCYNWDLGTATDADGRRYNRVELPSATNSRHFAGVAARAYAGKTGGRMIEIHEPGSVCNVLLKADVVIGVGVITCQAGGTYAGYFTYAGFEGRGSAVPLQTVSASTTPAKCLAALQSGAESGLVEVLTPVAAGGAVSFMVGGVTVVDGATVASADLTTTIADGTIFGERKSIVISATIGGSHDLIVTVTHGEQRAKTATTAAVLALASATLDDAGDKIHLQWVGGVWQELYSVGAVLAAA
jgi:hypothetical protein